MKTTCLFLLFSLCAFSQEPMFYRASVLATITLQTIKTTGFHPVFTKTGSTLYWKWPDGTYVSSNGPTKTLSSGTKLVRAQSQDGFITVTAVAINNLTLTGTLPSFATFTSMTTFDAHGNSLTGTIPSFATCTALTDFELYTNAGLTGTVSGSFATQKNLATINISGAALTQAAVDQILSDCVASLVISGRVACALTLSAGTSSAPSAAGLVNAAALTTAGWSVVTN